MRGTSSSSRRPVDERVKLMNTNIILGLIMTLFFVVQLVLAIGFWDEGVTSRIQTEDTYPTKVGPWNTVINVLGDTPLFILVLIISGAAAIGRFIQASIISQNNTEATAMIMRGTNVYQWVQYIFTWGALYWVTAQLAHVQDLFLLLSVFFGTLVFCLASLVLERQYLSIGDAKKRPGAGVDWTPYIISLAGIITIVWLPIFYYFITFQLNVSSLVPPGNDVGTFFSREWYAWITLFIMFFSTILAAFVAIPLRFGQCKTRFKRDSYFYLQWLTIQGAIIEAVVPWLIVIATWL